MLFRSQETVKPFRAKNCWTNCPPKFGILGYWVEDQAKAWQVYNHLARTAISLEISAEDALQNKIYQTCVPVDIEGGLIYIYKDSVVIPDKYLIGSQRILFEVNSQHLGQMSKFNGRVMERAQCQS